MKEKAAVVSAALAKVKGTGTSPGGAVTVTVDAAGHLRDIRISSSAYRSPNRIPGFILQATAAAEAVAESQAAQIMQPITSDPRLRNARTSIRQLLGPA
jgi:DNA-binding protein YbaB